MDGRDFHLKETKKKGVNDSLFYLMVEVWDTASQSYPPYQKWTTRLGQGFSYLPK